MGNPIQQQIWPDIHDPVKLREGKLCCPACGQLCVSHKRELTVKMGRYLVLAYEYLQEHHTKTFSASEIFKDDKTGYANYTQLKYFKLIEPSSTPNRWRITDHGYNFLKGESTCWDWLEIFDDRVVFKSDTYSDIKRLLPDWKFTVAEYKMDYTPHGYRTEIPLKEFQPDKLL